jgi:hypothetical protein
MARPGSGGGGLSTAIPRRYRKLASAAAQASGLPLKVVAAQIDDESGWNPRVTSPTGAEGIAQFEPGTWATWGHGDAYNPADAFPAYGRFMGHLLKSQHGDLRNALAAYNAGPGNIPAGYGYADTILAAAGLPESAHAGKIPYRNPLRGVHGLVPERVDMGVDYAGSGPVYAIGPGVITEADHAWAGGVGAVGPGTFITERVTKGPLAGRYVYTAENIISEVHPGQHVDAGTVIGRMTGQGAGIETGFAAGPRGGETLAAQLHQQSLSGDPGANPTAAGQAYSRILHALGAPSGTVSGTIHGSNPSWLDKIMGDIGSFIAGGAAGATNDLAALGGIGSALGSIAQSLTDAEQAIAWFFVPNHWIRIFSGLAGSLLVGMGLVQISRTGKPYSVNVPVAGPVPASGGELAPAIGIAEITLGAVLLFVAFHNLPADVTDFGSFMGHIQEQAQAGQAAA